MLLALYIAALAALWRSERSVAQYTATYLPSTAPNQTEGGQTGTNACGTTSSQTSMCQNVYINSASDFCVWGPPKPGPGSDVGDSEAIVVAWCVKSGYGTRLIPDGTLQGVYFVQTPDYVQVTGVGDFTKINIPAGDGGGELDPHGATGSGNPVGGLVFSSAFGPLQQLHEWTNFMAYNEFCIRGCKDGNTNNAAALCNHIYDLLGCDWNMPANYNPGVFENCLGDSGEPMGVYGASTFHQGDGATPPPHPAPATSSCTPISSVSNGVAGSSVPGNATGTATTKTTGATSTPSGFSTSKHTPLTPTPTGSSTASPTNHGAAQSRFVRPAGSWLALVCLAAAVAWS